jgi:uncharacterized protein YecA (UPF0149 family)
MNRATTDEPNSQILRTLAQARDALDLAVADLRRAAFLVFSKLKTLQQQEEQKRSEKLPSPCHDGVSNVPVCGNVGQ